MPEKQKLINLLKVISDRKLLSGILALDILWINFFTWRWNGVSFLRYFDFYILGEFTNFRICIAIRRYGILEVTLPIISLES